MRSPTLFMQVPALEIPHHAQEFDLSDCAVWINVPCALRGEWVEVTALKHLPEFKGGHDRKP